MLKLSEIFIRLFNWLAPFLGRKRVQNVDTTEVIQLLERSDRPVVLVDVRNESEINVSRIPDAITRAEFEADIQQYRRHLVVTYCTVGGRSLMYAANLASDGFEVRNYQGSILAWCAAGQPLVDSNRQPTKRVHTYSRKLFKPPPGYEAN